MEALLLIFAEIIIACMMPFFALIAAALAGLLEMILALFALLFGGVFETWRETRRKAQARPGETPGQRRPLIPRKLVHWSAGILAGLGLAGALASVLLFQPVLRHVLESAAAKAGATIQYEEASGTLLFGTVTLGDVRLRREDHPGLTFDMQVAEIEADVRMLSLIGGTPVIELARVSGLSGYVSPPPPKEKNAPEKARKARKPFRANLVEVRDIDLEVRPKDSAPWPLRIEIGRVEPFRSQLALFDLLFRSTLKAELAGQPLSVETRRITEAGRETLWSFEHVEADKLQLLVPRAPLTWLSGGTLSARVEDRWSLSDDWIDMDWRIAAEDMTVTVPEDAGRAEKLLGGTLAKLVKAKGGDAELRYKLTLDREQIAALRAGDLDAFWDTVLSGIIGFGGDGPDEAPDADDAAPEDEAPGAIDKLKNLFRRDQAE